LSKKDALGETSLKRVPIEAVELSIFSPRKGVDESYVASLSRSISAEGQLRPILVRPHPSDKDRYQVIDGESRVRAVQKLGLLVVRAEILDVGDAEALALALRLNEAQGRKPNGIEEGLQCKRLLTEHEWSQKQVGMKLSKSQGWVSIRVKIAENSSEELVHALITRVITPSQAREIVKLRKDLQAIVVDKVVKDKLTYAETGYLVRLIKGDPDSLEKHLSLAKNELAEPPQDLAAFEKEHPDTPKFEELACPMCDHRLQVDWVNHTVRWEEVDPAAEG
jgi:ParB family chromosome partitioning protein